MFIPMIFCPLDKVEALRAIATGKPDHYVGYTRSFIIPANPPEEVSVDTRYDEELRAAGLIK